jgi:hypothetical protein
MKNLILKMTVIGMLTFFTNVLKGQTWDIVCEVWEYSNERFDTGVDEIDAIESQYSVANVYSNTAYEEAMLDVYAQNQEFQEAGTSVVDWTSVDPFSEGNV